MDWDLKPPFGFKEHGDLIEAFKKNVIPAFNGFGFNPQISDHRIAECFFSWRYDLEKSVDRFRPDVKKSTPDHVKCAGYLMYWIRRNLPIYGIEDDEEKWATEAERETSIGKIMFSRLDSTSIPGDWVEITKKQEEDLPFEVRKEFMDEHNGLAIWQYVEHRNRIKNYANEYAAWDFCYRLAASYEKQKRIEKKDDRIIREPSFSFIDDFCYYLKYKSVSPHSLAFTLRTAIQE